MLKELDIIKNHKEFCDSISIHSQVFYDIKKNKRGVTLEMLSEVLRVYNINPAWVLCQSDDIYYNKENSDGNLKGNLKGNPTVKNKNEKYTFAIDENVQNYIKELKQEIKKYIEQIKNLTIKNETLQEALEILGRSMNLGSDNESMKIHKKGGAASG